MYILFGLKNCAMIAIEHLGLIFLQDLIQILVDLLIEYVH